MATYVIDRPSASDVRVTTDALFPYVLGLLFIVVYTQGYLERIGVPGNLVKMIVEMPVFVLIMHLTNRGVRQLPPGCIPIALYVIWTVVSAVYHGDGIYVSFLYCRYVLYAYIVFAAVWSTPLTRTAVKRVNTTIALLFAFQIVAAAYEVFILGERVEAHVGSLSATGGGPATAFPLLAMGLTVPLYLCYRRSLIVLLLSWAYFLVGYASGKRAIYFLGPFLYLLILAWYLLRVRTRDAFKGVLWGILTLMCLMPLLLQGVSRSHQIGESGSASSVAQIVHAFNTAVDYTTAEGSVGRTRGRTATNRRVLTSTLLSGESDIILVGQGPAAMRNEVWRSGRFMIEYGICGWARDAISIGWPGMVLYVLFYLSLFYRLRVSTSGEDNACWAAMRFGAEICFVVFLICHLTYTSTYVVTGVLSYAHMYVVALVLSPVHHNLRRTMRRPLGI